MSEYPILCLRGDACGPEGKPPRPTEGRGWFCPACEDRLRANLTFIAERWAPLTVAVTSVEAVTGEQGRQKRGGKTHGLRVSHDAIEARRRADVLVSFMVHDLLDRWDEQDRTLPLPERRDTPALAKWLADWRVIDFTTHPGDQVALEVWTDAADVARRIRWATTPRPSIIDVGIPCDEHGTSDLGERVPCEGRLTAAVTSGQSLPDLRCSADPTHLVTVSEWMHASWKRTRSLDPGAVRDLVRQIGRRHTSEAG